MAASASSAVDTESIEMVPFDFETLREVVPLLGAAELVELVEMSMVALKKFTKSLKSSKTAGVRPAQLNPSQTWVNYVLEECQSNGWEAFEAKQKSKDKATGVETINVVEMPASVFDEERGAHVFAGMCNKDGTPKTFNMKEAMSLSSQLRNSDSELYRKFMSEHKSEEPVKAAVKTVRKSAAQVEEERVEKLRVAEEAKAEKKRLAEEAKAEKKRVAEEKKAQEKAEKAASAKAATAAPKPIMIPVRRTPTPPPSAEPAKPAKAAKAAPKAVAAAEEEEVKWVAPAPGKFKKWEFEGEVYIRNSKNEILKKVDGENVWVGVYIEEENRIDESAQESE